jgi:hypothetical protein
MLCGVFEASIVTDLPLPPEETRATLAKAGRFVKLFFPALGGFPFTNMADFDTVRRPVGRHLWSPASGDTHRSSAEEREVRTDVWAFEVE